MTSWRSDCVFTLFCWDMVVPVSDYSSTLYFVFVWLVDEVGYVDICLRKKVVLVFVYHLQKVICYPSPLESPPVHIR